MEDQSKSCKTLRLRRLLRWKWPRIEWVNQEVLLGAGNGMKWQMYSCFCGEKSPIFQKYFEKRLRISTTGCKLLENSHPPSLKKLSPIFTGQRCPFPPSVRTRRWTRRSKFSVKDNRIPTLRRRPTSRTALALPSAPRPPPEGAPTRRSCRPPTSRLSRTTTLRPVRPTRCAHPCLRSKRGRRTPAARSWLHSTTFHKPRLYLSIQPPR